jgi:hypothetical protein
MNQWRRANPWRLSRIKPAEFADERLFGKRTIQRTRAISQRVRRLTYVRARARRSAFKHTLAASGATTT